MKNLKAEDRKHTIRDQTPSFLAISPSSSQLMREVRKMIQSFRRDFRVTLDALFSSTRISLAKCKVCGRYCVLKFSTFRVLLTVGGVSEERPFSPSLKVACPNAGFVDPTKQKKENRTGHTMRLVLRDMTLELSKKGHGKGWQKPKENEAGSPKHQIAAKKKT